MRPLSLTDFLLMVIAASQTKKTPKEIFAAYEAQRAKSNRTVSNYSERDIDEIYNAYPTHDPANNNRSTGKSLSDKSLIRKRLLTYTKEELLAVINATIEQNNNGTWLKNFSTFLKNLPDIREEEPEEKSIYQ